VDRIVSNDARTRLGDAEALHQLRVGARRLRSDVRTFDSLLDKQWVEELRSELRWLGGLLGGVRDLDVMAARLHVEARELEPDLAELFWALKGRHAPAHEALLRALHSPRYVRLLDRLVEGARRPPVTRAARSPSEDVLPPLVAQAWRRLSRSGRALRSESPDGRYHQVRVRAKQARYAAEAVAPALAGDSRRGALDLARRAARLQDVLGELQDSVVARDTIAEMAAAHADDGSFCLAAGRLLERESMAASQARGAFPRAWKKLDRKKQTRWMKKR
jgi:CHAD domain-containing protein